MKCQMCGKDNASIHIQEIRDGKKRSYYICKECAAAKGGAGDIMGLAKMIYNLTGSLSKLKKDHKKTSAPEENKKEECDTVPFDIFPQLMDLSSIQGLFGEEKDTAEEKSSADAPLQQNEKILRCSCCGWGLEQVNKTGRMGCPACYGIFAAEMEKNLKKMHRGTLHAGKYPMDLDPELTRIVAEDRKEFFAMQKKNEELAFLQKELENKVKQEEYEEAAILRDKISSLQMELKNEFFGSGTKEKVLPEKIKTKKSSPKSSGRKKPPENRKKQG